MSIIVKFSDKKVLKVPLVNFKLLSTVTSRIGTRGHNIVRLTENPVLNVESIENMVRAL